MRRKYLIGIIALMSLALLGCPNPQSPSLIVFNDGATVSRTMPVSTYTNAVKFIGDGAISYTSSAPAVASVGASNGVVSILSIGQTTITANMAATVTYKASSASYTLTIIGYASTIVFADGATVTKNVGSGAYTNAVSGNGAGVLSYASSAPAVATVDSVSGAVTPLAEGQTVITAAKAATATHGAVSASYTLTVALNASTIVFANGTAVTRSLGTGAYTNTVSGAGTGAISYTSSVPAVATVDAASGAITLITEGQTVITAAKAATASHSAATASYTLTVGAPLTQSTIAFNDGAAVTREFSTATYTNGVSGIGDGALSYTSGTPATATVNSATGAVTFVDLGTTVITANRAATATCTAATASYTLTVSAPTVPLTSTISFAEATLSKKLGSAAFINAVSGIGNGAITYASGTPATATVNSTTGSVTILASGTTIITATKAATAIYTTATNSYTLTVLAYALGETGPGGGLVAYDKGSVSDGWRFIEIAPEGWYPGSGRDPILAVKILDTTTANTTGARIGDGRNNTNRMLNLDYYPAAKAVREYAGPANTSDWFLPSSGDLMAIVDQPTNDILEYSRYTAQTRLYASSTEVMSDGGYYIGVAIGTLIGGGTSGSTRTTAKTTAAGVVAIRYF